MAVRQDDDDDEEEELVNHPSPPFSIMGLSQTTRKRWKGTREPHISNLPCRPGIVDDLPWWWREPIVEMRYAARCLDEFSRTGSIASHHRRGRAGEVSLWTM
jgi:hypothetical protein